jgi:hypothetical protein
MMVSIQSFHNVLNRNKNQKGYRKGKCEEKKTLFQNQTRIRT